MAMRSTGIKPVLGVSRERLVRSVPQALLTLGTAALLVELASVTDVIPHVDVAVRNSLVTAISFIAAAAVLTSGLTRPRGERAPWLVFGLGLFSYSVGSVLVLFVLGPVASFPTPADLAWLSLYPFAFLAIGLLVRQNQEVSRPAMSLDAAIVALALAALGYELIFNGLIDVDEASNIVGGALSFSILDFALLAMVVLVCARSRGKVGGAYFTIGAGLLVLLVSDVLLVRQIAAGTYEPGTFLDAGWPAALLLFGLSAQLSNSLDGIDPWRGSFLYGALIFSFIAAFALLLHEALGDRSPMVILLAALVPCLILIRLIASVRANERLSRDKQGMIRAAGEGMVRTDVEGRITYANPAALKTLGYTLDEVVGKGAHNLFHHTRANGTSYPAWECPAAATLKEGATCRVTDEVFWRKDGTRVAVDYSSAPIREGGRVVGAVTVFDDVSRQREMRDLLQHQADHDSLTGLLNRRRFEAEIQRQLEYARHYSRPGALLFVDLDSFKFVNDSYGHPCGDRVLCEVAGCLRASVVNTDDVARLGGDEFGVLLREASEAEALEVAKRLVAAIRAATEPTVGASIGIAPFTDDSEASADELSIAADVALFEAKEAGGGRAVIYAGQNGQALTWVEKIRSALAEDRFVVHAQPILHLATGEVAREELLVRMVDAHGDQVPPSAFLPAAERFGLIQEIDRRVLAEAIDMARDGRQVGANVSGRTLSDPRYLSLLERAVGEGLDGSRLNFEITETAAVANMSEAQDFARFVGDLGCTLSLDDFGTGFSSFAYLKHIPAQYLKIDIEFVRELAENPADQQLVQAIVWIARALGQETVAEGIESEQALTIVRELGVDYAQGFHVGRPRPATQPSSENRRPETVGMRQSR